MTSAMQSKSRDCFTGLTRAAPTPAFANSSSRESPIEVRMITGMPASSGSAWIVRAIVIPSMPGICISEMIKSYLSPVVAHCKRASASRALETHVGCMCQEERW